MIRKLYGIGFFIFCALQSDGQIPRSSGLLLNDSIYNSLPKLMTLNGAKFDEMPLEVSLKSFCPSPEDQGDIGSCVGWATGYGALTMLRSIQAQLNDQEQINEMANSASFIFNQIKEGDCKEGAFLNDALEFLKEKGDCLANTFPNSSTICDQLPNQAQKKQASLYRIKDYAKVFNTKDAAVVKISQIKKLLADSIPVVVALELDESFWALDAINKKWKPLPRSKYSFVHALVIVGYNEWTEHFELMNSYGENWGNAGFFEISYADFAQHCKQAYTMVLKNNSSVSSPKENLYLTGSFSFRQLTGKMTHANGSTSPIFENRSVAISSKKGIYQLEQNSKIGDFFQLIAQDIPSGQHLYILSLDAKNKAQLHWPKDNFATFVPSQHTTIILPHKNRGLVLSHKGTDQLIILYSYQKLEQIKAQVQQLESTDGDIKQQLKQVFGHILIPDEHVQYAPDKMQFQSNNEKEKGSVVALVLSVTTQ